MAGFALLVLAGVQKVSQHQYWYLALGLMVAISSQLFRGWQPGIEGLDYFADVLFGKHYNIYFPLFPWLSCILFGMFLSARYISHQQTDRLFKEGLWMGLPMLAIGGGLCLWDYDYHFADFFHIGPGGILYLCGLNMLGMWLVHQLLKRVPLPRVSALLSYCSRYVTSLYITQWVVICWGMALFGFQSLSAWHTATLIPTITVLVIGGHYLFTRALRTKTPTDNLAAEGLS